MIKCDGCIYYTKMNTYTTSPSTTRDELVEKYGEYYTCSKPYTVRCPRLEVSGGNGCVVVKSPTLIIAKRCAICGNNIELNSDETICAECKEAIKKLKEMLNNDK